MGALTLFVRTLTVIYSHQSQKGPHHHLNLNWICRQKALKYHMSKTIHHHHQNQNHYRLRKALKVGKDVNNLKRPIEIVNGWGSDMPKCRFVHMKSLQSCCSRMGSAFELFRRFATAFGYTRIDIFVIHKPVHCI